MTVFPLQANMSRGELTPYLHARVDTDHYQAGLAEARNAVITRYGGMTRVPGTLYTGAVKDANNATVMLPFEFNREQVYAIEAGNLYFRFWTRDGRVESAGTPVEVVTPYTTNDLRYLRVRQSGDVVYIWCKGYQPQTLTRNSETSWTLADYVPQDGPYMRMNTLGTTLTPASTGHLTPDMTSLVTPSGTVTSSGAAADAWEVFDRDTETDSDLDVGSAGYVQYDLGIGNSRKADAYWMTAPVNNEDNDDMISIWEFQGSTNGVNFVTLDSRQGETGWGNSETRYFEFENDTAYRYHRLTFKGGGGPDAGPSAIAELAIHQKASDQTPFNLTASSTTGINGGAGWDATDVGRPIRLKGGDNKWRWAEIVAVSSTTVVTIRLHGHALPDTRPIAQWQLGAWSDITGWPYNGAIYEDRLVQGPTTTDPLGLWYSVNGDYDNFRLSDPLVDDDAVSVRLTGGNLNALSWIAEQRDIVAGTAGSLRAVGRNNQNTAFAPANVRQRSETIVPSSEAEPVSIENVLLFIDYYSQRLYEAAYTYETESFLAREVSTLNEHLFAIGVTKLVYLSHPHKIAVALRTDGKLVFFAYDREQKITGGTLVDFDGAVEDIMVLPGPASTDMWMIVRRTVNGSTARYIERLAEFWRSEYATQAVPLYGACGAVYDDVPTTTVSAPQLANETVGVWADGRDIGDAVVSGAGVLTLPGGVTASEIAYGIRLPFRLKGLRLSQIGNQDGAGLGRKVNIATAYIDVFETPYLSVGSVDAVEDLQFSDEAELDPDAALALQTGIFPIGVDDSWKNKGVFVIETDRMYPATVRAVMLEVDGEP